MQALKLKLRSALDRAEAAAIGAALWLVRRMEERRAADLFGFLARNLGPLLPVTKVGDVNLRLAMPELDAAARRRVLRGVWDSLGRTVAEFPHIGSLGPTESGPGWEFVNEQILRDIAASDAPAVLVGAHIGNWEILPAALSRLGLRLGFFYRAASNAVANEAILQLREQACRRKLPGFAKGAQGARQAVAHLSRGGHLGVLFDQKLNNGISVKLFGHQAMTAPAAAALALKFNAPLVPVRVQRIGPARFRLTVENPLERPHTGNNAEDIAVWTQAINDCLEAWVRDDPTQWLWLHRRWPKEVTNQVS